MSKYSKLAERLDELADAVTQRDNQFRREFYMSIPARPGKDADLVLSEAATVLRELEAERDRLRRFALRPEHHRAYATDAGFCVKGCRACAALEGE